MCQIDRSHSISHRSYISFDYVLSYDNNKFQKNNKSKDRHLSSVSLLWKHTL